MDAAAAATLTAVQKTQQYYEAIVNKNNEPGRPTAIITQIYDNFQLFCFCFQLQKLGFAAAKNVIHILLIAFLIAEKYTQGFFFCTTSVQKLSDELNCLESRNVIVQKLF